MIDEIISQWDKNKNALEDFFKSTNQSQYGSYKEILNAVFANVITDKDPGWDYKKMTLIDDGDYQGTQIFIIPMDTYQPETHEYLITHTYYGSCSGCDTLQGISEYDEGLPSQEQVAGYMTIALHLVQKMKKLAEDE